MLCWPIYVCVVLCFFVCWRTVLCYYAFVVMVQYGLGGYYEKRNYALG
jgi:hypothetical protein